MKKKLKCATLYGGEPCLLSVEYRYEIFGLLIPVTLIMTRIVARSLSSAEFDRAVADMLK